MKHKPLLQFVQTVLATAGLLHGLASQATNVADLPIKTSVLAKPNVIFAMDDSGSMDWEVMLRSDNGFIWWDPNTASAWDATNRRPVENSGSIGYGLSYLFPMGTDADFSGGQLYGVASAYGLAAPPIAQLAWTRSSSFNPIYYNTAVTYPAWSPAYVSGAMRTYANASTTAAPGHPGPFAGGALAVRTLNVGADWNSGSGGFTEDRFKFWAVRGMVLPSGTQVVADSSTSGACNGSTVRTLSAATTVTGTWCLAAIPYYPATFWQRTVCPADEARCVAAPDCTVSNPATNPGSTCVNAPDGVGKLRRYEIRSGNTFPSGRSHADELQNFANWFTYHRKRKLLLAGAMGRALEPVSGLRLGVVPFCEDNTAKPCTAPTMYDADAASSASNRFAAAGRFYLNGMSQQGTPTHTSMAYVARQFDTNTSVVQYACQRNSLFVVTDGFSNTTALTPPAWDSGKSASTWGGAAPYQTTATGSLADLALHYYTNRLRATGTSALPAGKLPPGDPARINPDPNTDLHITTYGITLGARGTLFPTYNDPFSVNVFTSPPAWPTPVADDPTMVDDLWHATVNGRGRMYQANDSEAMRDSITAAFSDILGQVGAQSALAVTSINLQRGDAQAYLGTYVPAGWAGDLTANPISATSGVISNTPTWSAAQLLASRDWTTRVIASFSGSAGVTFTSANVGNLVNPSAAWGTNDAVVDWLRGSRSGEGTSFRRRSSLMGAVINAEPVPSRDDRLVYVASGEGMLHAFDTVTGREHWAFVPGAALANLGETSSRSYAFRTRLDATPALGRIGSSRRILVGAMGSAGRSVYALDVSNPRDLGESALASAAMWQFPAASDTGTQAKMGYSYGRPVIAKTSSQGDVVLVTSGYDKGQAIGDGRGRMWMLNASTGAILREFVTTDGAAGAEAGLGHVAGYRETDGTVRHVYGGDLLGNLWHFDLDAGTTVKLAQLRDSAGNAQPVTAPPELVTLAGKRVVLVGTGRLLDITDFGSSRVQSFYAIADGALLSNARSGLLSRSYSRGASPEFSGTAIDWSTARGWYFDLPAGEQANTAPVVAYGNVGFTTNVNGGADCSQSSWMYLLDLGTGLKSTAADFASALVSNNANTARLTALRLADGSLVGTTRTSDNSVSNRNMSSAVTIQPSKNVWREIRR